jgi:NAD/NADP transhydrogenase beta subunit
VLKVWRALAVVFGVLAMVLGVVVVVQAVMLHAEGWHIAMGTVPEWLAAFGTVVAIAAVLVAALGYRHEVRSRTQDERQRREVARRQQAGTAFRMAD